MTKHVSFTLSPKLNTMFVIGIDTLGRSENNFISISLFYHGRQISFSGK